MKDAQVIIIGAGPVGLMLANFLGDRHVRVLILDRRTELPATSQAIGVTPPSLRLFAKLGLDHSLITQGVKIQDCHVHGQTGYLGCASFRQIDPPYRYILSLPQRVHMQALEERLARLPHVTLKRGEEITGIDDSPADTVFCLTKSAVYQADYLIGCDGHRSLVRQHMHVQTRRVDYGCHFIMGDFTDVSDLGEDAHLWFTKDGAVESFPLPGGLRRWIVQSQAPDDNHNLEPVRHMVRQRTGHDLPLAQQLNQTSFSPWRLDCSRYSQGRVSLCGDAAHVMSPIGGQGMNTGWADAEFLAGALIGILEKRYHPERIFAAYEKHRRHAAKVAADRAAQGMWLGTWRGRPASLLRDFIMGQCLFKGPLADRLGPHFAMQTIPFKDVDGVPFKVWEECSLTRPGGA